MNARRILSFLALALALAGASACVLNFDVVPDDIDATVSFTREASCADLAGYTIIAKQPYDKTFTAQFGDTPVVQHWVAMPEEEVPLEVQLAMSDGAIYGYEAKIDKSWGQEIAFSASCDDANPAPVLLIDKIKFIGVFTIAPSCRPFKSLALLELVSVNADTGQAVLTQLATSEIRSRRWQYFWPEPEIPDPVVVVRLTDGLNCQHDFAYRADLSLGQRFDFAIGCEPEAEVKTCSEAKEALSVSLSVNGQEVPPYAGDEETEGEGEGDGDEEALEGEDGDADGDDDATDGDASDGDETPTDGDADGDTTPDGDLDTSEPEEEEEVDLGCGDVEPQSAIFLEAEDVFSKDESQPSELANIVDFPGQVDGDDDAAEGDVFDGEEVPPDERERYVRLDAEAVGAELVFVITVGQTWPYKPLISYVGGKNWGEVSLFIDDAATPVLRQNGTDRMNLAYPSDEWPLGPEAYQAVCLTAGEHRLRVRVVGTQKDAYTAGVDVIRLLPD
ncbi:MAG: hypothetical protein C4523_03115 [Myxococcales bacterium]|nr:MAG: hypothetical protein C4523_03115 [Myxococcales bacterium]